MILCIPKLGEWSMGPYLGFPWADFWFKASFLKKSIFCKFFSRKLPKSSKNALKNSAKKLKNGKKRFSPKTLLMCSDGSNSVPNHSPDLITSFSTAQHVQNAFAQLSGKSTFRRKNLFFAWGLPNTLKKAFWRVFTKIKTFCNSWYYVFQS